MGIKTPNQKKKKTPAPLGVGDYNIKQKEKDRGLYNKIIKRLYKNYKRLIIDGSQCAVTRSLYNYYTIIEHGQADCKTKVKRPNLVGGEQVFSSRGRGLAGSLGRFGGVG